MADIKVPTLSVAGWIGATSTAEKADTLLAHSFAANKSQTGLYGDSVTSIQWLIQEYGQDITTLVQKMRQAYYDYFLRYFPEGVDVDVHGDPSSDAASGKINLRLIVTFTEKGKQYSVGNIVNTVNGKFAKVVKLNEDGTFS